MGWCQTPQQSLKNRGSGSGSRSRLQTHSFTYKIHSFPHYYWSHIISTLWGRCVSGPLGFITLTPTHHNESLLYPFSPRHRKGKQPPLDISLFLVFVHQKMPYSLPFTCFICRRSIIQYPKEDTIWLYKHYYGTLHGWCLPKLTIYDPINAIGPNNMVLLKPRILTHPLCLCHYKE